jgi:hypothetical protein
VGIVKVTSVNVAAGGVVRVPPGPLWFDFRLLSVHFRWSSSPCGQPKRERLGRLGEMGTRIRPRHRFLDGSASCLGRESVRVEDQWPEIWGRWGDVFADIGI